MLWSTVLLFLVSTYVAYNLISLTLQENRLKYLGLTIASALLAIVQLAVLVKFSINAPAVTHTSSLITEWGHITCLAFVLSSLAVFIRESKPVFAQFPLLYTAFPLLIVLSYLLVKDTYALKTWLLVIYQGGAITVSMLMYLVYTNRRSEYAMILSGVVVLLLTYVGFWYISPISDVMNWGWKILAAVALWLLITGYKHIETIRAHKLV